MDQRREFVRLAKQEGANRRELCRRFGIHPDTGYKWLARWVGGDGTFAIARAGRIRARRAAMRQWKLWC
jgi:transposase-like protein